MQWWGLQMSLNSNKDTCGERLALPLRLAISLPCVF